MTTPLSGGEGRDRTHGAYVGGGAFFGKPQERKFGGKNRNIRKL
jgi:hypothetical protein